MKQTYPKTSGKFPVPFLALQVVQINKVSFLQTGRILLSVVYQMI